MLNIIKLNNFLKVKHYMNEHPIVEGIFITFIYMRYFILYYNLYNYNLFWVVLLEY